MHASEVAYVFNTLPSTLGHKVSKEDQAMAEQIQTYWVNFAKTGNPNSAGLPYWSPYTIQQDELLIFSPQGAAHTHTQADPWRKRLDLIESLAQK